MDANTKDVLMALIALVSAVVTPLVVVYVGRQNSNKVNGLTNKVDEYHKAVNGGFQKLLDTTAELATANEKARNEATK